MFAPLLLLLLLLIPNPRAGWLFGRLGIAPASAQMLVGRTVDGREFLTLKRAENCDELNPADVFGSNGQGNSSDLYPRHQKQSLLADI